MAGGYARRLKPLTENMAKPLLPIAGRPLIGHIMEKVEVLPQVDEIIIFTNEKFKGQFESWLSTETMKVKAEVVAEPSRREEEKLGAIKALAWLLSTHRLKEDLLIIAGDNFFTADLGGLINFYLKRRMPVIAVYKLESLRFVSQYSTVKLGENGLIEEFVEKPEKPRSALIGTGIYVMPEQLEKWLEEYLAGGGLKDNLGSFIQWLYRRVKVYGYPLKGYWADVGTEETYLEACRKALESGLS